MDLTKLAFISSNTPEALRAKEALQDQYASVKVEDAECVVALGGDGLMLETLHLLMDRDIPVYGMNLGTVGFLMNDYVIEDLHNRISRAKPTIIRPLSMDAIDVDGKKHHALALNEVSLFRGSYQAAKIGVKVDGKTRLNELVCDGILLATPAGSTAYNLSAHGPILPLDSTMLALTPISPFRPRRWRGALLSNSAEVTFTVHEQNKRPVHAVADNQQYMHVTEIRIHQSTTHKSTLLYDPGHGLEERVLNEQFRY